MTSKEKAHSHGLAAGGNGLDVAAYAVAEDDTTRHLQYDVMRVERFLRENPILNTDLNEFAEEKIRAGKRFGIQELAKRWRWHRPILSDGDDFGINNSWCPIISRILVERYPHAAELIEQRPSRYDAIFEQRKSNA